MGLRVEPARLERNRAKLKRLPKRLELCALVIESLSGEPGCKAGGGGAQNLCGSDGRDHELAGTEPARDIVEAMLVRTGECLSSGDFELFEPCFEIPQEAVIFDTGTSPIRTRADLRALFVGVRKYYAELDVDRIIRPCIEATFHDENTIYSTHVTFLLKGNEVLKEPYPVFSSLRRFGDNWKIVHSVYAIAPDMSIPDWAYRLIDTDPN